MKHVHCTFLQHLNIGKSESLYFFFLQFYAQILYFNTFITFLYMFRALLFPSSGGQLYQYSIWYRHSALGDCSGHMLRKSSRNLCTEQSPKESDDVRCCTNTIVLPKISTIVLETCTGM
jgi:hypothetical protein